MLVSSDAECSLVQAASILLMSDNWKKKWILCALSLSTKNNLSCTFRTGKSASPSYSCQDTEAGVDALGFGWFARHSTFTNCPNLSVTQV